MRIVGGSWRGRSIAAPPGTGTRPTTDRVREALFSALSARMGADLGGGRVLDAFAGSGALGLEALSRGASQATFIESQRAALSTLRANIAALDADDRATVLAGDTFSLADGRVSGPFALILLDPPYTLEAALVSSLLATLGRRGACENGTVVVWEHAAGTTAPWPSEFCVEACKRYGSTAVDIAVFEGRAGE